MSKVCNRVLITGVGVCTTLGQSVQDLEVSFKLGRSGIRNILGKNVPEDFPVPYAAGFFAEELMNLKEKYGLLHDSSTTLAAKIVVDQALQENGGRKIDAVLSYTADGTYPDILLNLKEKYVEKKMLNEYTQNVVISELQKKNIFSVKNHLNSIQINAACATGSALIGIAFEKIRAGAWKRCLIFVSDMRCDKFNLMNYYRLGTLNTEIVEPQKASRPFSRNRKGMVRGEGAGALLLESESGCNLKKNKIFGQIMGYGCKSDAYQLTEGPPSGDGMLAAMTEAIDQAGLCIEEIDYIKAHGTGTIFNDKTEANAIMKLIRGSAKQTPVSSLKGHLGHLTTASGIIELIVCATMLKNDMIYSTLNLTELDEANNLNIIRENINVNNFRNILCNNFGFGGQNASLILGCYDQ